MKKKWLIISVPVLVVLSIVCFVFVRNPTAGSSSVFFPPDSANLRAVSTSQAVTNMQTFTRVARQLARSPQSRVLIEGHANAVLGTETEERQTLMPLSQQRAEAAANFLVSNFHIDRNRIIISAAGGGYPASKRDGSLNRRVKFSILRN